MRVPGTFVLALALALASAGASAAPPEQFCAWGAAGPQLPRTPKGWRELPPAELPATAWTPTAADRRRGYVLFAREAMAVVSSYARPFAAERVAELSASAARGEYEPVTFCIHALEAIKGVRVEGGELRDAAGGAIPADHLDVRVVACARTPVSARDRTYRLVPFLLERRESFDIAAERTAQVWLTVRVPPSAKAGLYTAAIAVRPAGRPAATLKLRFRVLPFVLPPAPVDMGLFYGNPPADDAMLTRQFVDMREHGCGPEDLLAVQIVTRDRVFGDDDAAATRAFCRRMVRAYKKVFGPWKHPASFSVGNQIICYWDKQKNWFVYWKHDEKMGRDLLRAVDVVCETVKAAGGPPLRAYVLDEAGAHMLLDEAVYWYRFLKRHRPHLPGWTSIGGGIAMGVDEIGGLSDCCEFIPTNRFSPEIARALVGRGKPFGVYNGARHDPASARFFYGFHGFKTGAVQIAQWCYSFGGSPFGAGGMRNPDAGYVHMAADGPVPSIMWEAVREGVDDYRYVYLLRKRIAAARASKDVAATKAAGEAQAVLTDVIGRIQWGFQAVASDERTPTPHAATLRKWRRRIAREIVKLGALVDAAAVARADVRPPNPLKLPWPKPAGQAARFGPEMLPPSGFDKAAAPWRVEAWKGKGTGTIDRKVRFAGAASMRMDVPAGSSSQDVTVLVWPNWGPSKVNVRLEGGRVYEFSAMARWEGRGTPPGMRLSLPQGVEAATRSGADEPDAAGWRRLWVRSELKYPTTPKYLGVWVQGAGTVWIDDLSLREVRPQPIVLSLDQGEYDALDRVAVASVTVGRDVTPVRLRFTLADGDGRAAASHSAPFRARTGVGGSAGGVLFLSKTDLRRCDVVFSPASLRPGRYVARMELLGPAGKVLASQARPFVRLRDEDE